MHGNKSEAIIEGFSNMVFNLRLDICKIKLKIVERNTMIAQIVGFTDIIKDLSTNLPLTAMYLSGCTLNYTEYETLLQREFSLSILYILHSSLRVDTMCAMLSRNNKALKELFFHSSCTVTNKDSMITSLYFL